MNGGSVELLEHVWSTFRTDALEMLVGGGRGDAEVALVAAWLEDPSSLPETLAAAHAVSDEASGTACWPAVALTAITAFPWAAGTITQYFWLTATARDAADARWTTAASLARAASLDPVLGHRVVSATLSELACSATWQEAIDMAQRWADESAAARAPQLALAARTWLLRAYEGVGRWTSAPPGWSHEEAKTALFRTATACVVQTPYLAEVHVRMAGLAARGDAVALPADVGPAMRRALDRGITRLLGSLGPTASLDTLHAHRHKIDGERLRELLCLLRQVLEYAPFLYRGGGERLRLVRALLALEAAA